MQHWHYPWNYGYLKAAVLRNKIIYWQNFRHQANLTLTNTLINTFSTRKSCTSACIKICLLIAQYLLMLSIYLKIFPNILFQQLCFPFSLPLPQLLSDVLTELQVTSAGPGPLCTHVQCTSTTRCSANLVIPDISGHIYICINFIPLEIGKTQLFTSPTAIQT